MQSFSQFTAITEMAAPVLHYCKPKPDPHPIKVVATIADHDEDVELPWGSKLRARKNLDYIVHRADDPSDRWVVRKDIFDKTYVKNPDGTFSKNPNVIYKFFISKRSQTVNTLEGPVRAAVGDYILVGVVGEKWPVPPEKFFARYVILNDEDIRSAPKKGRPPKSRPNLIGTITATDAKRVALLAKHLSVGTIPKTASVDLGPIILSDGREVRAHVVHAVDAVITDGSHIVVIKRKHSPGQGLPALPGGFIDPVGSGAEHPIYAAVREAHEETGIRLLPTEGKLIGKRRMYRPYDVRQAYNDLPQYGIAKGDVFMVSTRAVLFGVPILAPKTPDTFWSYRAEPPPDFLDIPKGIFKGDRGDWESLTPGMRREIVRTALKKEPQLRLRAGDDAAAVKVVPLTDLTRKTMGVPDHYDMIVEAMRVWTKQRRSSA